MRGRERVKGQGFGVKSSGVREQGIEFWVMDLGFTVWSEG